MGTNVGIYSVYAALRNSKISVYSFEPEYSNLNQLKQNILNNNLSFSVPKIYDLVEFEKGITMFNEESNNYGLSKIKDRIFGEIEKCWDENELNYYDGKYAEGFRKCDIEEGDTDYDYPLTIADDWSWIAIYVETDEEAIDIINEYAPEHYIIQAKNEDYFVENIENAGKR